MGTKTKEALKQLLTTIESLISSCDDHPDNPNIATPSTSRAREVEPDLDFEVPTPAARHPLPSLVIPSSTPKRRRSVVPLRTPIENTRRQVRSKSFDIICIPFQSGTHFVIPRGKSREELAKLNLIGKITISSLMAEVDVRNEISHIFGQQFKNSEGLFNFYFLSSMPGSKKLMIPNVSPSYTWCGTEIFRIAVRNTIYIMPSKEMVLIMEDHNTDDEFESEDSPQPTCIVIDEDIEIKEEKEPENDIHTPEDIEKEEKESENDIHTPITTIRDRIHDELGLDLEPPEDHDSSHSDDEDIAEQNRFTPEELLMNHIATIIKPDETCTIYVRRSHILEDFSRACLKKTFSPTNKLKVKFIGEPGIDGGGISREFLDILSRQLCSWKVFAGKLGNFTLNSDITSLTQELPYVAGVAIGMVLCHIQMPVPILAESLIKHIAGTHSFAIEDVPDYHFIELFKKIQDNDTSVITHIDIESLKNEMNYFKNLDSPSNRQDFLNVACRYLCSIKNGAHIAQFVKGLGQLGIDKLIVQYTETMSQYLTGAKAKKTEINANNVYDLFNFNFSENGSNMYTHEQTASFHLMQFLMDCCCGNGVHNIEDAAVKCCLRDFLQFVTGIAGIPAIREQQPQVTFAEQAYPSANVCTLTLIIPVKLSEDVFRSRLYEAILGSPEFGKP